MVEFLKGKNRWKTVWIVLKIYDWLTTSCMKGAGEEKMSYTRNISNQNRNKAVYEFRIEIILRIHDHNY